MGDNMTGDYFYLAEGRIHGGYYTAGKYYYDECDVYPSVARMMLALILIRAGLAE